MPAHWFAIIAPENPNDQWIYAVYQIRTVYRDDQDVAHYDNFNYQVCSIYAEEDFINEYWTLEEGTPSVNPISLINGEWMDRENLISDNAVSRGTPIVMIPYLNGTASPPNITSITNSYENVFHTHITSELEQIDYLPINRIITYDQKKYIVLDSNHLIVRLS